MVKLVLWMFGVIVLVYLGVKSIKGAVAGINIDGKNDVTGKNPLVSGYMVNMANPVAIVFWVGIFGSMLGEMETQSKVMALIMSSTILVGILMWHTTMAMVSNWGKGYLNDRMVKYVSVVAGIALIAFGMKFAYSAIIFIMG